MQVELDIFSGRPNPTWGLDQTQCQVFLTLLGALPRTQSLPPEPPGLGYRGFVVSQIPSVQGGLLRAFQGYIKAGSGRSALILRDEGRKLERWLLESGKGHLEGRVYQVVVIELGK
jgi:hypothetical protein